MNTTTDNATTSPTINEETLTDRQERKAREAREEFTKVKAQAYKLKAEAHAAVIEASVAMARVKAYEEYLEKVKRDNEKFNTSFNPQPYSVWGWEECVLCHNEIRDDPFGHNAAPQAEGICCSDCNQYVINQRQKSWVMGLIDYMNNQTNEDDDDEEWEWCSGCNKTLKGKDLAEGKKCGC